MYLEVNVNKYIPFKGGGSTFKCLPKSIQQKKAVLNILNHDDACFAWSVVAALHKAKGNVTRTSSYPHYDDVLNLRGISFPTPLKKIKKFEKNNNVSINVYGLEHKKIVGPLHFSTNKCNTKPHINLLYVDENYIDDGDYDDKTCGTRKKNNEDDGDDCDEEDNWSESASDFDNENDMDWLQEGDECNEEVEEMIIDSDEEMEEDKEFYEEMEEEEERVCMTHSNEDQYKGHYCLIKNLSRLVSNQLSRSGHVKHICDGCLVYFNTMQGLQNHSLYDCSKIKAILHEKNILKFKNFKNKIEKPFVVYGNFETLLKPVDGCENNVNKPFTQNVQLHQEFSFAYFIKCSFNKDFNKFVSYRGCNATQVFIKRINEDLKPIFEIMNTVIPMLPLTVSEKIYFASTNICHICEQTIFPDDDGNKKVHDHCHLTGKFRGPAHNSCNINYKLDNTVPFVFHNLGNYDLHLMIRELGKWFGHIDILPINKEKYISLTKHVYIGKKKSIKLRFIDSFRFLNRSLDTLVSNLNKDQFYCTNEMFITANNEQKKLIFRKGVFPYEYVDSFKRLNETQLPSHSLFFDKLNNKNISEDDYTHATNVWFAFECKTLGEYSDLYLKLDVLLLCDVFENFRCLSMNIYALDPAHYFSLPGLSWDAMLKYTKIELELFTDIDMLHFIKNNMRGGLVQCNSHHATAFASC